MKSLCRDILNRIPKENDLIICMIISRDSDGMRYGIWHDGKVYSKSPNRANLVKSVPSNFYIVENAVEKELQIKEKLMQDLNNQINKENMIKKTKPLKASEYIVGHCYEDRKGYKHVYLGRGKVTGGRFDFEGYLYLPMDMVSSGVFPAFKTGKLNAGPYIMPHSIYREERRLSHIKDLGKVIDIIDNPCVITNMEENINKYGVPQNMTVELFDVKKEKER